MNYTNYRSERATARVERRVWAMPALEPPLVPRVADTLWLQPSKVCDPPLTRAFRRMLSSAQTSGVVRLG